MAVNVYRPSSGMPTNGQVYKDPKSGLVHIYNEKAGSWMSENEIGNTPGFDKSRKAIDEYKTVLNQDPNAMALSNLEVLAPDTFLDNPIAQVVPLSEDFKNQKEVLRTEAAAPTGMSEQDKAVEAFEKNLNATPEQIAMQKKIEELYNTGRDNKYETDMYESIAGRLRREASRMQGENQADLASRGLGMSTVVNDVNSGVQRELMAGLTDAGYKAAIGAEDLRQRYISDALGKGIDLQNNIVGNRNTAASNISAAGVQKNNLFNTAQNAYNSAITYEDANQMQNLNLQNQAWKDKIANFKYFMELPFAVNNAGNQASANATSASNTQFKVDAENAANDNNNWMNLIGSGLSFATGGKWKG